MTRRTRWTKLFYKLLRFTRRLIGFGQYGLLIEIGVCRDHRHAFKQAVEAEVENQMVRRVSRPPLRHHGVTWTRNETGFSCELRVSTVFLQ